MFTVTVLTLLLAPRLALVCSELKLREAAAYHEEVVGQMYLGEMEQARYVQGTCGASSWLLTLS